MKTDWISYGALGILVIVWGSAFALTSIALEGFSPMGVANGRVILATLIVVPAAVISGQGLPKTLNHWLWAGLLGILNFALPFSFLSWGQLQVPSAITAIYISAVPLIVLVFSRVFLKQDISYRRWFGFAIGFAGLVILADPRALIASNTSILPQLALLVAAVGYAGGSILIKVMPDLKPLTAISGALIVASIAGLPFGIGSFMEADADIRPMVGLLLLGVIPTGFAQTLRFFAVKRAGPVFLSIVGYLIPIWAGMLGVLFLDETVGRNELAAYALIMFGLLIARQRRKVT